MAPSLDAQQLPRLAERLASWLPDRRWFGGQGRPIARVGIEDWATLAEGPARILLGIAEVEYAEGPAERYFVPLALRGVQYRAIAAASLLRRNLVIYGLGGLVAPFVGIKAIDLVLAALGLA